MSSRLYRDLAHAERFVSWLITKDDQVLPLEDIIDRLSPLIPATLSPDIRERFTLSVLDTMETADGGEEGMTIVVMAMALSLRLHAVRTH